MVSPATCWRGSFYRHLWAGFFLPPPVGGVLFTTTCGRGSFYRHLWAGFFHHVLFVQKPRRFTSLQYWLAPPPVGGVAFLYSPHPCGGGSGRVCTAHRILSKNAFSPNQQGTSCILLNSVESCVTLRFRGSSPELSLGTARSVI